MNSLIERLKVCDRINNLRRRVELLPTELFELYKYMLNILVPLYRQQASQLFQITLQYYRVASNQYLSLLQSSYADEEDLELAIRMSDSGLTAETEDERASTTNTRLLSRCCGLLEVAGPIPGDAEVNFMHRTVVEFLTEKHIEQYLLKLTSTGDSDPIMLMLSSSVTMIKNRRL